jgi:phosphoribosylanthranilate isomerase
MYRTRIKICGLTRPEDAAAAVEAGADAVGVVLAPSKRQVTLDQAARVLAGVPPLVARVGVFVDAAPAFVADSVARLGLTYVQFHGDESPEACSAAPVPVIKAVKVGTSFAPESIEPFRDSAAAILLDTLVTGTSGGTGKAFDWHTISAPPGWAPLMLAGGLDATNVADAIRTLHPYAVDVSSGVEDAPGIKNPMRIRAFVAAVRAADDALRAAPSAVVLRAVDTTTVAHQEDTDV